MEKSTDRASGGWVGINVGKKGKVVRTVKPDNFSGRVRIDNDDRIRATSKEGELDVGTEVEVIDAEGIHVTVVPIKGEEQ